VLLGRVPGVLLPELLLELHPHPQQPISILTKLPPVKFLLANVFSIEVKSF